VNGWPVVSIEDWLMAWLRVGHQISSSAMILTIPISDVGGSCPEIDSPTFTCTREVLKVRHGAEDARHPRKGTGPLLWGDFTSIKRRFMDRLGVDLADVDMLVGGTPCQSFSVAGLRKSLADDRGNLALEFIRLANAIDNIRRARGRAPIFILWENVPGVLSTPDNALGCFLGGMVGSDAALVPPGKSGWTDSCVVALSHDVT